MPAPAQLTGRNTGLDLPTAISGFTGKTTVAVTDAAGVIQRRVEIDFDAGTMSVDGGAATGFNGGNFLNRLNTALGSQGSASFANGALSHRGRGRRQWRSPSPTTPRRLRSRPAAASATSSG